MKREKQIISQKDQLFSLFVWSGWNEYLSPKSEKSIAKGIPLKLLPTMKRAIKAIYPNRTLVVSYCSASATIYFKKKSN